MADMRSWQRTRTVMVFGVFDILHPGHIHFLQNAARQGDVLIVVLARDEAVHVLKGSAPRNGEKERAATLRAAGLAHKIVLGDVRPGTYRALKLHRPHVVALGYDQSALGADLRPRRRAIPF